MNKDIAYNINYFLAQIATHYMEGFQGDILFDHQTIMERLENQSEIECYVAKKHFDTEKRFEYENNDGYVSRECTDKARQEARKQHWGEYIIRLYIAYDKLHATIEKRDENVPPFPLCRFGTEFVDIDNYDIVNEYGKVEKGDKKENP